MKIAFPLLGLLVVLGACYGLAFAGIIPVQKMADKNPVLAKTLIGLHLAKAKKPKLAKPSTATASAMISPEQEAVNTQKKQLADAQAKLAKDQADFEASKHAPAATQSVSAITVPTVDTGAKLNAIYAAMSPDDLTALFTRLPDPDVIAALITLDEKKAGKVLAALPPARAARLTRQMSHPHPVSTAVASL